MLKILYRENYLPNRRITTLMIIVKIRLKTRQLTMGKKNWKLSLCTKISPGSLPRNGIRFQNNIKIPAMTITDPMTIKIFPKGPTFNMYSSIPQPR
jgi:hypothetical protein